MIIVTEDMNETVNWKWQSRLRKLKGKYGQG